MAGIWGTAAWCWSSGASGSALSRAGSRRRTGSARVGTSRLRPVPSRRQSCGYLLLLTREYKSIFFSLFFFLLDITLSGECWSLAAVWVHCAELVKLLHLVP